MEYMKIEGFLGAAVSQVVNKAVENKTGTRPDIQLKELKMTAADDDEFVEVSLRVNMPKDKFQKLLMEVTK